MKLLRPVLLAALAVALFPAAASADEHPTIASDGLYIGARLEPGGALLVGYDLDIYLTGDRLVSLGPAVTFAFLGEDGADLGRRQDWLLAVDFLRLKVSLIGGEGPFRPYLFLGGGMTYASLPAQETEPREVIVLPDRTPATAVIAHPQAETFNAQIAAGAGADLYLTDSFGLSLGVAARVRLTDDERMPLAWGEAFFGVRFGL